MKIKTNLLYRILDAKPSFKTEQVKNEKGEVVEEKQDENFIKYMLSSEAPYKRKFALNARGDIEDALEILDHSPECVDMSRMQNGAPFLDEHNPMIQLGKIERCDLVPRIGIEADVRFSKNQVPQERLRDIKDGIRTKCSIGYRVSVYRREPPADNNSLPIYRAVAWQPYEGSSCSIAADDTVGTVRSDKLEFETEVENAKTEEPEVRTITKTKENEKGKLKMTKAEIFEIRALAKGHGFSDAEVIEFMSDEANTLDMFKKKCLDKNHVEPVQNTPGLGLSDKEIKRYSMANVLRAFSSATPNIKEVGYELELSRELQNQNGGVAPRTIYVPFDVFKAPQQRTGLNSTAGTGGYTIQTDVLSNEFIDVLRPMARVMQAGARVMSGLQGNVLIPKLSAAAQCGWVAEDNAHAESDQTFTGPTLSPKTLSGWTKIGRQLLIQSSSNVESIVRVDLTRIFALAFDKAALLGLGSSNEPKGIIKMAAPIASQLNWTTTATPSYADLMKLKNKVARADALVSDKGAFLANSDMEYLMEVTPKIGSTYPTFILDGGKIGNYPFFATNQFGFTTYATTCVFGDWDQMILGTWGNGVNMLVDPYTYSDTGALKVTALMFADIQVRHEESFAMISDSTFS